MNKHHKINRPADPYSKDWAEYWKQNPGMHRGVGAEPTDDEKAAAAKEAERKLAEYDTLKAQNEEFKANLEKLTAKHAEAEKHRKEQETAARKAAEEALKKSGDVDALEKSWNEKFNTALSEKDTSIASLNNMINELTVGAAATRLATELAIDGSADVLMPHLKSRLSMELRDGKPDVKVLVDGKPSALSLDDLKKEFSASKAFAPIIKGSSASGSGQGGKPNVGDGAKTMKRSEFDALDPVDRSKFINTDKGKVVDD